MKMKSCVIVACNLFNAEYHKHFIQILFEFADGSVAEWRNPSLEICEMMLSHSHTSIVYEHCNQV